MSGDPKAADAQTRRDARKVRWGVRLGGPFLAILGSTWRIEEVNAVHWQALKRAGKPYLLSCWHGELLPAVWANKHRDLCAMVSQHGDGEIIARLVEPLGFRAVRGSTTRGAKQALIGMVVELQHGHSFAITPDGPRGPAMVPQPGVLMAAMRAQVPIIPIRVEATWVWRMKSWDRFMLPKPFARIRVSYGDPWIPSSIDESARQELIRRMDAARTLVPVAPR